MSISLFDRWRNNRTPPRTEPGQRIYAIGDIHGCFDLHAHLLEKIVAHANGAADRDHHLVYLGDYIDRGADSKRLIETLIAPPPKGFQAHYLMGNHESMMLQFIDGDNDASMWLNNGGRQTLCAYCGDEVSDPELIHRDLLANLPPAHEDFLRSLKISHSSGDYLFVHAGVRPGVALENQSEQDIIWIRGLFLKSNKDFGKFVIHGHSIEPEPQIRKNRIGIDTGAWRTGVLTCLVLDGVEKNFLST
ncbi:MAG TPA: serine/threonine protein phosphatase [Rhodospirillales bacterium]|nr:serine/threonine protein phosphatase [Rhodospirillales bacterium]